MTGFLANAVNRLSLRRLSCATRGDVFERLTGLDQDARLASGALVAANDDVGVERIELDAAADAALLLGGDQRRARTEERIEYDIAAIG